jgi:transcriptional regulatory protein LevR
MVFVDHIGIFLHVAILLATYFRTNKSHSYKHKEQINNQNMDNSECFGVKFVKIYPEMTF